MEEAPERWNDRRECPTSAREVSAREADGSALLGRLQSSDAGGLYDQFTSFLLPFEDFISLESHNPTTTAAAGGDSDGGSRKSTATGAPKKRAKQRQQKKADFDTKLLRPLAKRFLPFLCQTLKILPVLLRRSPQSSDGAGDEVDQDRAIDLLAVYSLSAHCLWCIAPCLDGKPTSVLLHRGRLVRCLESWGQYTKTEVEALSLFATLCSLLVPSQKRKAVSASCFLPDVSLVGSDDPDAATLALEALIALTGSAFKSEKKDPAAYMRILDLVEQVLPWLRLIDHETWIKYHSQLVNMLYRCAVFLATESTSFDGDLVRRFCLTMSRECLKSSYVDRFPSIARKVCSSADLQWQGRPLLILDMLRITLESIVCSCKVAMVKIVNEYLEFVSYCADSICSISMDICSDASKLLYGRSGDLIQASRPIAAILNLYAAGLFLKSCDRKTKQSDSVSQKSKDASVIMLLLDSGKKLQILTDSLSNLASYFQIVCHRNEEVLFGQEVKDPKVVPTVLLESRKHGACKHLHENASLLSCLEALEFLCNLLVEYINTDWKHLASEKRAVYSSANVNHIQDALHQFCDFVLASVRCNKSSGRDKERLLKCRKTLLQVAVSALKIALGTAGDYQRSLCSVDLVISSDWIEPQELRFLISALSNIGASLYDIGHLNQASIALECCFRGICTHVKLLLRMHLNKSNGIFDSNISEDAVKGVIADAFTRSAMILDILHKCCAANIYDIAVKNLVELSAAEDVFKNFSGSLPLVKQWVKIMCKDFENVDAVDSAPVLYSLLLSYSPTCSKKTVGTILEQELLSYDIMEARNPILCQNMRIRVMDILLNDVYTNENYNLQRSRVLVRKGRALRACGIEGLSSCMECLSQAISLLSDISGDPSLGNAPVYHQLALIYCLHAQCAQEANQDSEVILQNVQCALNLWSSMDVQRYCSTDSHFSFGTENIVPLLCNIVDLLSLKGCLEYHFSLCKLIFIFCKQGNVPPEKCLAMLWTGRRLSHSLCISPIDGDFILNISEHLKISANSIEYWINCLEDPSSLLMFLQKFLLCDSILPEVSLLSSTSSFSSKVNIDEVKEVASSLTSDVPLASKAAFIAGYLYYDLSERLFSMGRVLEALSYAREALRLRKKILRRKFTFSFEQKPTELVVSDRITQNRHDNFSIEAIGPTITEVWLDANKSSNLEESIITPWSVLRCYLDSTLQVGMLHESTGNGAEAESIFHTGKRISYLQGLPNYKIAFTSLLGQLFRKKQLWDSAKNELNGAKQLLIENDMIKSCKHCKLSFEVMIEMQLGDLSRNLFEKGLKVTSTNSLSHALDSYRSALEKLNHSELEGSGMCVESETMSTLLGKSHDGEAKHGLLDYDKLPVLAKEVRSPVCHICTYLNHNSNIRHVGQMQSDDGMQLPLDIEVGRSYINTEVKKRYRNPSKRSQKEHLSNAESKPRRTRSSNRSSHNRRANIACEANNHYERSASHEFCSDSSSLKESEVILNGSSPGDEGCNKEGLWDRENCWRCLLIRVSEAGSVKNILSLKWECHRRRLLLKLLVRIAKCLGDHGGSGGAHEVHDVFWHCISVLYDRKLFSQGCPVIPNSRMIELIGEESSRDIFSVERATILYNMSWFCLKGCLSEYSRIPCCNLSKTQMSNVLPWLLRAFILGRELPLLFQKVSKLLSSLFILSTICGPISLPFCSNKSLSPSHWAAYFHQASLGAYLHSEYLPCVRDKTRNATVSECPLNASMVDTNMKESSFLRFAPEKPEQLEKFVRDFFQGLPSIPIVCISMLGGDYMNLLGETLLLPSFFPAWMLLTRLDAINQPIAMLLPVDFIVEELEDATSGKEVIQENKVSIKDWLCPWSYSIVDYVAPTFKLLLEENFLSLSNTTPVPADTQMNCLRWWSERTRLNDRLNKFLKSLENSWLGPWGCLLLGARSDAGYLDTIIPKLINALKSQCNFNVNTNLLKIILSGANSAADAEACISQTLVYEGNFGRGSCCGKERFRAFSSTYREIESVSELTHNIILEAIGEPADTVDREPIILVLDSDVQMLPWESLPILKNQEVYRMPSVTSISIALNRSCLYQKQDTAIGGSFPSIDPVNVYYLLNPSGDLNSTQEEFEQWFRNQNWEGKAGIVPTIEELVFALQNHDLFLYFGHGSGTQYIPGHEIQKLDQCAATLLMGCSSGSLIQKGCYAPQGAPLFYLFAGSPFVIANLWDVTDKDIDRFGKAMLNSWLQEETNSLDNCITCNQLAKELGHVSLDGEGNATLPKNRRKPSQGKKLEQLYDKGKCKCRARRKRIASFMSQAREACKLPLLIGAAPVCYGVPTFIRKKS